VSRFIVSAYAVQPVGKLYKMGPARRKAVCMGTWDWNDVRHELVPLVQAPEAVRLAAAIASEPAYDKDWERRVFEKTGLAQLSLVEWSICSEVDTIFATLRDNGSQWGYVVEEGATSVAEATARKIALTPATARKISDDLAMDFPMVFIDDQQLCILVSYFSDYALICMREDLFEIWLANNPIDLSLRENELPVPAADNLKAAREFADRRRVAWDDFIDRMRSP
jgi:hypothetical protein